MTAEPPIVALLETRASSSQRRYLDACIDVASRLQVPIYLVGGAIRDVLLTGEMPDLDLDIAVEGDAIEIASEVAHALRGDLTTYPRFLTAEVFLGRSHIDFVTARSEKYEEPAGLPVVSPGDIEADLARRDFAINAMALPLWPTGSGDLIDPFDGRRDLDLGQLRVLHDQSFFEDPTRILRGVRLSARLDLRLEVHTAVLARAAIAADAFAPLSATRLRHELILLFEDRHLEESLRQLEALGFLRVLGWTAPPKQSDWESLRDVLELHSGWEGVGATIESPRWWLVYLMSLAEGADESCRSIMAQRLGLDAQLSEILTGYPERLKGAREALEASDTSAHEVCRILDGLHSEELALLMAGAGASIARWIERWVHGLREIQLTIGGTDLQKAGVAESAALGRALQATLEAKVDGIIGVDQELEFAIRRLRRENG